MFGQRIHLPRRRHPGFSNLPDLGSLGVSFLSLSRLFLSSITLERKIIGTNSKTRKPRTDTPNLRTRSPCPSILHPPRIRLARTRRHRRSRPLQRRQLDPHLCHVLARGVHAPRERVDVRRMQCGGESVGRRAEWGLGRGAGDGRAGVDWRRGRARPVIRLHRPVVFFLTLYPFFSYPTT